jgi:uncharacterized integral membrane protein
VASFIRFVAAVACLLAGGVVGALNPQQIALDLGFATLHTSLGLGILVAILLGVVAGGLLVAVGVVAPLRQRLRRAEAARLPASEPGS